MMVPRIVHPDEQRFARQFVCRGSKTLSALQAYYNRNGHLAPCLILWCPDGFQALFFAYGGFQNLSISGLGGPFPTVIASATLEEISAAYISKGLFPTLSPKPWRYGWLSVTHWIFFGC